MLLNAHLWCLGMDDAIKADASIEFVGPYNPATFNFNGERRGVKPADIAGWDTPIYNKDAPTSFPTSRLEAMTMTAVDEPTNSRPRPQTEKKAEQPAMSNAEPPTKYLNIEGAGVASVPPAGLRVDIILLIGVSLRRGAPSA